MSELEGQDRAPDGVDEETEAQESNSRGATAHRQANTGRFLTGWSLTVSSVVEDIAHQRTAPGQNKYLADCVRLS